MSLPLSVELLRLELDYPSVFSQPWLTPRQSPLLLYPRVSCEIWYLTDLQSYFTKLLTSVNYFHAPLEARISTVGICFNSFVSNSKCEVLAKASSLYCVVLTLLYLEWSFWGSVSSVTQLLYQPLHIYKIYKIYTFIIIIMFLKG